MDFSIAAILAQDGLTSRAIYALLALALVLVFSITRVIFIPQGSLWPLALSPWLPCGADAFLQPSGSCWGWRWSPGWPRCWRSCACPNGAARPCAPCLCADLAAAAGRGCLCQVAADDQLAHARAGGLHAGSGGAHGAAGLPPWPQPLASASTLVLLIVSVGVHYAMTGFGLLAFGAEGCAPNRSPTCALS